MSDVPTYGPITVDRKMFVVAHVLRSLQRLRDAGLVEGGVTADIASMEGILEVGRAAGYQEPTKEELEGALSYFRDPSGN